MSTLAQVRERILTQVQNASGWIEPLIVTASAIKLNTGTVSLRGRLQSLLQDVDTRWATADIDEAIRLALEEYSDLNPYHAIGTVIVTAATREQSISSLTGLLRVEKVWWDYDSAAPGYPPNWRQFEVWPGSVLYIDDEDTPAVDDVLRVWYTQMHTINGLDSAEATTVPIDDVPAIVHLAAAFAAQSRSVGLVETLTVDEKVAGRLLEWSENQRKQARYAMRADMPAWQRRATAFSSDDVDEAIRWAAGRITAVDPATAIGTVTLSSASREVGISSLVGYLDVIRVWFPYVAGSPAFPPSWCSFDLWPGDIVFLDTTHSPAVGDVARLFYTKPHSIEDLDSATETTLSTDQENMLVIGASAFATLERGMEEQSYYTNTRLRYWAEARLGEFTKQLNELARRNAARVSGLTPIHAVDRWDGDWS